MFVERGRLKAGSGTRYFEIRIAHLGKIEVFIFKDSVGTLVPRVLGRLRSAVRTGAQILKVRFQKYMKRVAGEQNQPQQRALPSLRLNDRRYLRGFK